MKKVPNVLTDRGGFTLLETVVAMAILMIGIVGVMQAFSTSMAATREAQSYSKAAILAEEIATQLDSQVPPEAGQTSGIFADASGYAWSATVLQADSNNLMNATIDVTWQVGRTVRTFELVTCLQGPASTTTGTTP